VLFNKLQVFSNTKTTKIAKARKHQNTCKGVPKTMKLHQRIRTAEFSGLSASSLPPDKLFQIYLYDNKIRLRL
jgi:hypothetical protein